MAQVEVWRAHITCHVSSSCAHVFVLTLRDFSTFLSSLSIFSLIILSFLPGHQLLLPRCGGQIPCALLLMRTYDPLTGYEPNDYHISEATEPYIQESSVKNGSPNDLEHDDVTIGKALSSPLFTQEREDDASRRRAYHSQDEGLSSSRRPSVKIIALRCKRLRDGPQRSSTKPHTEHCPFWDSTTTMGWGLTRGAEGYAGKLFREMMEQQKMYAASGHVRPLVTYHGPQGGQTSIDFISLLSLTPDPSPKPRYSFTADERCSTLQSAAPWTTIPSSSDSHTPRYVQDRRNLNRSDWTLTFSGSP